MGNFGFQEMLLIAVVALLVFGPDRLPELARQAGKLLAKVRQETSRSIDELKRAADIEDLDRELRAMRQELSGVAREVTGGEPPNASIGDAPRRTPPPTDPDAT